MTPSLGFVDLSVINGEVIVKDGKLLTTDLQVCAATVDKRQSNACFKPGNASMALHVHFVLVTVIHDTQRVSGEDFFKSAMS